MPMTLDSTFNPPDSLDLERIKGKITSAYNQMLEHLYKKDYPGGNAEEMELFVNDNTLEFKSPGDSFDEDSDEVDALLDKLLKRDDLKPVAEVEQKKLHQLIKRRKQGSFGGLFNL